MGRLKYIDKLGFKACANCLLFNKYKLAPNRFIKRLSIFKKKGGNYKISCTLVKIKGSICWLRIVSRISLEWNLDPAVVYRTSVNMIRLNKKLV